LAKQIRLICDRCGKEVTDKMVVEAIFAGKDAWKTSHVHEGADARGLFPCENYIRCHGEMIVAPEEDKRAKKGAKNS
jgi:hypothetical protein